MTVLATDGSEAPAIDETTVILLVEDDDIDARRITRLLNKRLGRTELVRVGTVGEAVVAAATHHPNVIVADLTLPDADRLDAVRALVEAAPNTPLIVQSGRDDPDTPIEALRLGAEDYLVKDELTADGLFRSLRYAVTRHRLRTSLDETLNQLVAANADLEEVAAVFAHDLRGPVRTARLLSERIIAAQTEPSTVMQEAQELMSDALSRVDHLITTMLEYEDLRTADYEREPVHVASIVDDVLAILRADLLESDATCTSTVPADLTAMAHPAPLTQVLVNLLTNSITFHRPGVPPQMEISGRVVDDRLQVTVSDNGRGIPADQRERAMQVMQRLHAEEATGPGFGLAICRRIVAGLGGTIRIVDKSGPGTAVVVELPAAGPGTESRAQVGAPGEEHP